MPQRRDPFTAFPHACGDSVHTLPEAFQATARMHPHAVALRERPGGRSLTWADYAEAVERVAAGLVALSVDWRETVGLLLGNRPEFHLLDTAALHIGATPFSIYNTLPPEQVAYICANAANRVIVTERRFLPLVRQTGIPFPHVVCVDGSAPDTLSLAELMELRPQEFDFESTWRQVRPYDLATITYTSGTTGQPKGVELTHSNILAQLAGLGDHLPTGFADSTVSYLPAAHIADRITAHYANMVRGVEVTSVADPHRLGLALREIRPTVLFGVPRVWQKAKAATEAGLAAEPRPSRRAMARWALRVGAHRARIERQGKQPGPVTRLRYQVADALVLSRVRQQLGFDRIRFAASGAAPIPAETLEYFAALGIRPTEVWGLSEASGVSTTTTVADPAPGSVGKPLPGVEVRVAADGEILVRGPVVMRGYHRDPDRTREAFAGSDWLLTGDLGTIDENGDLRIIGRKTEMIINDSGKNIAPSGVENAVKAASFLVGQVMVIGEQRPYLTALVTLDAEAITADAAANDVTAADIETLVRRPGIRQLIIEAVRAGNATVSRPEQIKRFLLLDHVWAPGGPEITPKMSLRRSVIEQRYAEDIESLYAEPPGYDVIDLSTV